MILRQRYKKIPNYLHLCPRLLYILGEIGHRASSAYVSSKQSGSCVDILSVLAPHPCFSTLFKSYRHAGFKEKWKTGKFPMPDCSLFAVKLLFICGKTALYLRKNCSLSAVLLQMRSSFLLKPKSLNRGRRFLPWFIYSASRLHRLWCLSPRNRRRQARRESGRW